MKQIHRTFKSTTSFDIGYIALTDSKEPFLIPKDFLGKHSVMKFTLWHNFPGDDYLEIHSEALRSSRDSLFSLMFYNYNLYKLNFNFVVGFHQLRNLIIIGRTNLSSLPFLPKLTELTLLRNSDINNRLFNFPKLIDTPPQRALKRIKLEQNELNNEGAVRILEWLLTGSTLAGYDIELISLKDNNLTTLPSSSFKEMLEVMHAHRSEFHLSESKFLFMSRLHIYSNGYHSFFTLSEDPFDCTNLCGLAWLIRDNRHLLKPTIGYDTDKVAEPPACSNGTSFFDLDPDGIQNCPANGEIA